MTNKGLVAALAAGALAAGLAVYMVLQSGGNLEQIPREPIRMAIEIPLPAMLEEHVSALVDQENKGLETPVGSSEPAQSAEAAIQPAIPSSTLEEKVAQATADEPVAAVEIAAPTDADVLKDTSILQQKYAEIAYVEFGGLAARKMATFYNTLNGEKEKALEGGNIHTLKIDQIENDFVLLSYGKAKPMRKPRVDLEVSNDPNTVLSEAEQKSRAIRYQELYGNRFLVAYQQENQGQPNRGFHAPSAGEEAAARENYMKTYGMLFQRMQAGDMKLDPREIPNPDLNFDETVHKYFETYWPGQVDVTIDPASSAPGGK